MTLFSIKRARKNAAGFTLLEMLVVVLLVSLLASLLMQGFIYMAGTYSVVDRRQAQLQSQTLFEGWLRDSVHGIVNGVDGPHGDKIFFSGDATTLSAISIYSLVTESQGVPLRIVWNIEHGDGRVALRYSETPLTGGATQEFTIKEWPAGVSASWMYLQGGEWKPSFPQRASVFHRDLDHVLPAAVGLVVDTVPVPVEMTISLRANSSQYVAPVIEGVF